TIGADHPRPGIVATHSTFSVFDQRSGSALLSPTGFRSGPRNCGQSGSSAWTTMLNQSNATNHFIPSIIGASPRPTRSRPLTSLDASPDNWLTSLHTTGQNRASPVMFFRDNFEMRADPLLYLLMTLHHRARITGGVRTTP